MYLSLPVAFSEPSRLAAIAAFYGIETPPIERARVLELGCASGGNIIPLAARYPRMKISGFDIDAEAIKAGKKRAQSFGLKNIELKAMDIAAIPPRGDTYDFIICHGVYSWTPAPVRAAILKLCEKRLSPSGIALVSFNVLPGWRAQQIIRDICLSQNAAATDAERVAKARTLLKSIASKVTNATPYGLAVKQAAQRLESRPDSYILGEFFAQVNEPFFFNDFAAELTKAGLQYICDGEFSVPRSGIGEAAIDLLTGQTFRRAILSKTKPGKFNATVLSRLHVRCELRRGKDGYATPQGNPVKFKIPAIAAAVDRLIDAYPGTLPVSEIASPKAATFKNIGNAIMALASARQAEIRSLPLQIGRDNAPRPRAFALAQAEAASGQKWVSSLAHRAVPVGPEAMTLLGLMDGSRDSAALRTAFASKYPKHAAQFPAIMRALQSEALIEPGTAGAA